jgi:regulator of protease activity HflC (stomatin/prohibitin superfamily)
MNETPKDPVGSAEGVARHRDASARLEVAGVVGDAAELREAMDPANRSLADALQLSFRLLQAAIFCLLLLFLFSGFKTIETTQSGVATVWGRIVESDDLGSGLHMNWPAPVGEFVLFQAEGRVVDDGDAFMTKGQGVQGQEQSILRARLSDRIKPERDGSFVTSGGEIGHLSSMARFEIVDPREFLETVGDDNVNRLVRLALQQATVSVAARHTLAELQSTLSSDVLRDLIRQSAQQLLDKANAGIRIVEVTLPEEPNPPFFIQKSFEDYSRIRQEVQGDIESAQQSAQEQLIAAAGEHYGDLEKLLVEYEEAWGDDAKTAEVLSRIDTMFNESLISGRVFRAISSAKRYRTEIERTIGSEARRFEGLLDAWRLHPDLVIAQRLLSVRGDLLGAEDAEVILVPIGLGSLRLDISGLQNVRDTRRRFDLKKRADDAWDKEIGSSIDVFRRVEELKGDAAARQMVIDESGRLRGGREGRK